MILRKEYKEVNLGCEFLHVVLPGVPGVPGVVSVVSPAMIEMIEK